MYQNITQYEALKIVERMDRIGQFDRDGWLALINCLEGLEEDTGEAIEFDVIALCCEFQRFESMEDYWEQYSDGTGEGPEDPGELEHFACMINDSAFICYAH